MKTDEPLDITDMTCCYVCGAKEKRYGNSLHCWDIEYDCGCKIWGAISEKEIYLSVPCPRKLPTHAKRWGGL